jgi:hypothetical protein
MALFFDTEWFDARLAERGLTRGVLAAAAGLSAADLAPSSSRTRSAAEVALRAGVSPP